MKVFHDLIDLPSEYDESSKPSDGTTSTTSVSSFEISTNNQRKLLEEIVVPTVISGIPCAPPLSIEHPIIPRNLSNPVNKEKMSILLNNIVLVHRLENMVMGYASWKGSTVLLVPIPLVTFGGYRGFQQSQVKYKC